ncbi:MAG: hybrid sensor histidine kinase/response regulator [Pseudomonadota bacterium]
MTNLEEALQRAQHTEISAHIHQEMVVNAMCVVFFVALLWPTGPTPLTWLGVALIVGSDLAILRFSELWIPTHKTRQNIERALKAYIGASAIHGVAWCLLLTLIFNMLASNAGATPLILLVSGFAFAMTCGAIVLYGMLLPRLLVFIVPVNLAGALQILRVESPVLVYTGVTFTLFIIGMIIQGRVQQRRYVDLIEARFRNEQLLAAYRQQKEIAELSSRAKTRFLAAASHDLRQPIHAIGLLVDTLETQVSSPDHKVLTQSISDSVRDLTSLLEVILDISRINAGLIKANEEPIPVSRILGNLHKRFVVQALDKQIDFRVRNSDALVHADQALVERVLGNLVSNAIKYTERGGVLIGARKLSGDSVRLDVWDTGIGIPRESLDEIFLEYYQIGNLSRASTEGLGLGLSIVKGLCDALGYRLSVTSRVNRGSVFSITLPLAERNAIAAAPRIDEEPLEISARVLIIDDDRRVLGATHQLLAQRGYDVRIASSEADAVQLIDRGFVPEIVFCDYRLDDKVIGSDVLNSLRQRYGEHIRGVLITADTDPQRLVEASESGYLLRHKPLSAIEIRRTLAQLSH